MKREHEIKYVRLCKVTRQTKKAEEDRTGYDESTNACKSWIESQGHRNWKSQIT